MYKATLFVLLIAFACSLIAVNGRLGQNSCPNTYDPVCCMISIDDGSFSTFQNQCVANESGFGRRCYSGECGQANF